MLDCDAPTLDLVPLPAEYHMHPHGVRGTFSMSAWWGLCDLTMMVIV